MSFSDTRKAPLPGPRNKSKGDSSWRTVAPCSWTKFAEMDLEAQVTLLRILEGGRFRRVGGTREIEVDVRVIAATNKSLQDQVKEGRFREDLFYRLNVVRMSVPSLRERREDIQLLAQHFLDTFRAKYHRSDLEFVPEVEARFADYSWPGNIRELRNCVERAVILARGSAIGLDSLPESLQRKPSFARSIRDFCRPVSGGGGKRK